jgi:hypothetical protein
LRLAGLQEWLLGQREAPNSDYWEARLLGSLLPRAPFLEELVVSGQEGKSPEPYLIGFSLQVWRMQEDLQADRLHGEFLM